MLFVANLFSFFLEPQQKMTQRLKLSEALANGDLTKVSFEDSRLSGRATSDQTRTSGGKAHASMCKVQFAARGRCRCYCNASSNTLVVDGAERQCLLLVILI